MDFENQRLALLYGSQTGNAQDLTERLYRESKRFYFGSVVKSLDQYNVIDLVKEQCAIFICSTTGQGEEPDNMKHFWKFLLRKSLPSNSLCSLKFAVLGLGDSSYPKFNFVAKRLHKRLLQLGGQSIIPLGLGDDQHDLGYDAVADLWFQQLFSQLLQLYPLPNGVSPLPKNLNIKSRWNVFIRDSKNFDDHRNILCKTQSIYYSTSQSGDFTSKVIANERITDVAHFQDIRLLKLQSKGKKYCPGDVLVLRPRNLSWKIKEFKEILSTNNIHISDDTVFQIIEKSTDIPVPEIFKSEVTFQQLCEEYFDLFSIPRRSVFKILAQLTDSELEKEKCLEFCAAEGQQEMYSYVHRPRRNIVEILQDFPHATKNLTPDMLFEILPPIKAREFSIASSFAIHKNEIHLLVAVVKYKTKLMKERLGLCSNYLADLKPGDDVTIWIKKGCFKFPQHLDSPVIMVGPGTGVAPFRNFIFDVLDQITNPCHLMLFYGCRYKDKDFLCREEFERLSIQNQLTLICAFSRDQEEKVYVQHKIEQNGVMVWEALQKNARIYIAGNSKNMPQGVRESFVKVCQKHGAMSENEALQFINNMEKKGLYQTECWS